jgi:hypothetical protein
VDRGTRNHGFDTGAHLYMLDNENQNGPINHNSDNNLNDFRSERSVLIISSDLRKQIDHRERDKF